MDLRDLFVALVAMSLGAMMLHAAIMDQGWCFQMRVARAIEDAKGRAKARSFVGTVGAAMILIGLYVLLAPILLVSAFQGETRDSQSFPDARVMTLADSE